MMTREQNDLLTQTGPGTPGGKFLRSYWHPVATAEEMPIGGAPLSLTILSEKLVLFRDEHDRLGLVGRHCPHRGTDLSYGRIEGGGLRCLYHGWLFDINGKCLEQPGERKQFCQTVSLKSYPVQEKGGAIWAYMGEGEPPLIPDFQFLIAPEPNRIAFRTIQMCNWLQGLESVIDPVHTTYLHRRPIGTRSLRSGNDVAAMRGTAPPKIETEPTNLGMRIYALHEPPNGRKYLRVNNYVYPCGATPTTGNARAGYQGRFIVPRDDQSHYMFEFIYRHYEPLDKDTLRKFRAENVAADGRHVRREENRYLQDREEMTGGGSFCGMGEYFPAQDAFAIESQGAIRDSTQENLGSSDVVIVAMRRMLLKAIAEMQDGGDAPGLIRNNPHEVMTNFICFEGPVEDDEDGPTYCRRLMSGTAAAE
jgi:phthalate 4,5-dioxygenase